MFFTFGSVCSGIEAASVAWHPLGWRAAWLAEIEPFPSAVLAHHYPDVPNLGDMTELPELIALGHVDAPDVFCGGTPCQAFSVAGLRQSLDDARGNLSLTFCEIANAIDISRAHDGLQPCIVFWENVPGVLSTRDNAFGCFLAGLAGEGEPLVPAGGKWPNAGFVFGPQRAVAWRVLDAQYFGVAQRRRRVFVVASARDGFDPTAVLFEFDGLRRDTAPSREAGKAAPTIPSRSTAGGGLGTDFDLDGGLIPETGGTLCAADGKGKNGQDAYDGKIFATAHTLRGEGFDAGEDGTGRGTPLVPVVFQPGNLARGCGSAPSTDVFPTLKADHGRGQSDQDPHVMVPLPFDTTQITSKANYSNPKPGDACHPLAAGAHAPAIALQDVRAVNKAQNGRGWNDDGSAYTVDTHATQGVDICIKGAAIGRKPEAGPQYGETLAEIAYTQNCVDVHGVMTPAMQVRRLTPVECERLQGFPDGYTAIPWRKKPADECPDGPRYKALGNSWAVPVVRWIGWRIAAQVYGGLA